MHLECQKKGLGCLFEVNTAYSSNGVTFSQYQVPKPEFLL